MTDKQEPEHGISQLRKRVKIVVAGLALVYVIAISVYFLLDLIGGGAVPVIGGACYLAAKKTFLVSSVIKDIVEMCEKMEKACGALRAIRERFKK